jgi:propionyl-CoA synthetase
LCRGDIAQQYERIKAELVQLVRDELGPMASFRTVGVVKALPKTRSGKRLRGTMSKIANGEPYKITPTIEDATIFDTLAPEIVRLMENQKRS